MDRAESQPVSASRRRPCAPCSRAAVARLAARAASPNRLARAADRGLLRRGGRPRKHFAAPAAPERRAGARAPRDSAARSRPCRRRRSRAGARRRAAEPPVPAPSRRRAPAPQPKPRPPRRSPRPAPPKAAAAPRQAGPDDAIPARLSGVLTGPQRPAQSDAASTAAAGRDGRRRGPGLARRGGPAPAQAALEGADRRRCRAAAHRGQHLARPRRAGHRHPQSSAPPARPRATGPRSGSISEQARCAPSGSPRPFQASGRILRRLEADSAPYHLRQEALAMMKRLLLALPARVRRRSSPSGAARPAGRSSSVDVTDESARRSWSIAVPVMPTPQAADTPAGNTEALGRQVAEIVAADLRGIGLFTPRRPRRPPRRRLPAGHRARLSAIGAAPAPQPSSRASSRPMPTAAHRRLLPLRRRRPVRAHPRRASSSQPRDWRRAAHNCADAIYSRLTGESPFFDTRIVYVAETGPRTRRVKRLAIMD